jgi:pyridoxine 5-phosphate synthase
MSLLLGVNIDHVATLRQARFATMLDMPNVEPSPLQAARDAQAGGADSITLHVRGDRRHIQEADAFAVRQEVDLPLNFEMASTPEMIDLALRLKPDFACLVPENRQEISTEGGLDVLGLHEHLVSVIGELQTAGIQVSLFIDPEPAQVQAAADLGAEMVELHTGCFANALGEARDGEIARLVTAAREGKRLGLQVNAGHGINYDNVALLFGVPGLTECNIGHTIVSRAMRVGMSAAVREMRDLLEGYPA